MIHAKMKISAKKSNRSKPKPYNRIKLPSSSEASNIKTSLPGPRVECGRSNLAALGAPPTTSGQQTWKTTSITSALNMLTASAVSAVTAFPRPEVIASTSDMKKEGVHLTSNVQLVDTPLTSSTITTETSSGNLYSAKKTVALASSSRLGAKPLSTSRSPKMEKTACSSAASKGQIPFTNQPLVFSTKPSATQVADSEMMTTDKEVLSKRNVKPTLDDLPACEIWPSTSGILKSGQTSFGRTEYEFKPEKPYSSAILPRPKTTTVNTPTNVEMSFATAAHDSPILRKELSASGPDGPQKEAIASIVTSPASAPLIMKIPRVRKGKSMGVSNSKRRNHLSQEKVGPANLESSVGASCPSLQLATYGRSSSMRYV